MRCVRGLRALPVLFAACAAQAQDVRWYTVAVDGVRTGYVRAERGRTSDAFVESESITFFVRELGRTARLQRRIVFRHDGAGKPLGFDYALDSGITRESWQGTFDQGSLHIRTPGISREIVVDLPDETVFTPDPAAF